MAVYRIQFHLEYFQFHSTHAREEERTKDHTSIPAAPYSRAHPKASYPKMRLAIITIVAVLAFICRAAAIDENGLLEMINKGRWRAAWNEMKAHNKNVRNKVKVTRANPWSAKAVKAAQKKRHGITQSAEEATPTADRAKALAEQTADKANDSTRALARLASAIQASKNFVAKAKQADDKAAEEQATKATAQVEQAAEKAKNRAAGGLARLASAIQSNKNFEAKAKQIADKAEKQATKADTKAKQTADKAEDAKQALYSKRAAREARRAGRKVDKKEVEADKVEAQQQKRMIDDEPKRKVAQQASKGDAQKVIDPAEVQTTKKVKSGKVSKVATDAKPLKRGSDADAAQAEADDLANKARQATQEAEVLDQEAKKKEQEFVDMDNEKKEQEHEQKKEKEEQADKKAEGEHPQEAAEAEAKLAAADKRMAAAQEEEALAEKREEAAQEKEKKAGEKASELKAIKKQVDQAEKDGWIPYWPRKPTTLEEDRQRRQEEENQTRGFQIAELRDRMGDLTKQVAGFAKELEGIKAETAANRQAIDEGVSSEKKGPAAPIGPLG